MKNLPESLKLAFSALEFTKAGNLTVLTALLDQQDRIAQTTPAVYRNAEPGQDSSSINSPDTVL
jgi:hypothetical protein